jgi:predicted nucleic acid-binding protein
MSTGRQRSGKQWRRWSGIKKKPHSLAEARQLRMKMLPINSSAVEMIREAYWIAVEDRIAFYDSLFLAASEKENAPLLTMDRKLYERAKQKRNVQMI